MRRSIAGGFLALALVWFMASGPADAGPPPPDMPAAVHFAQDSTDLSDEARAVVDRWAAWMAGDPDATVRIEGHAGDQGTSEYSLGLGERLAGAVKIYLVNRGIDPGRIETISYGKEMSVAADRDIADRHVVLVALPR